MRFWLLAENSFFKFALSRRQFQKSDSLQAATRFNECSRAQIGFESSINELQTVS